MYLDWGIYIYKEKTSGRKHAWGLIYVEISDHITASNRVDKLTGISVENCDFFMLFQEALLILQMESSKCDKIHDLLLIIRKWCDWQTLEFPNASQVQTELWTRSGLMS
jgi:hypothetical protein